MRRCIAGHGVGHFLQLRERLGQLQQHHVGVGEKGPTKRQLLKAGVRSKSCGVVAEGPLPRYQVLVDLHVPDAAGGQRPESEGAVAVTHYRDSAVRGEQSGRCFQEQPVGGIPGLQVGGFDIREPAQTGED
ncbi:hypothetical protein D9M72_582980 [compost metagenome]